MRFISTSALWWLLLGAIVILLYLLKIKRPRVVVPSVLLWRRALEEIEAATPFRRLRRSLSLVLQLLALSLLVFALARPLITTRAISSGNSVLIIDATASMSTRDEDGVSRLDRAKQMAREMVRDLQGDSQAAIIESSSRVTLRAALTPDKSVLRESIDQIEPTDTSGGLTDAVRLAEQIAGTQREGSIVVLSDGCVPPIDSRAATIEGELLKDKTALRFVRVGRRGDNVGIVSMNSRPTPGAARQELFASVANFGQTARSFDAELRIEDRLVDARTVTVAANDRTGLVFDVQSTSAGMAELRLSVDDDLSADNVAYCYLPDLRRFRVGVVSENRFLLGALAVNKEIDARRIDLTQTSAISQLDCLVVDGPISQSLLSSETPLLLINPPEAIDFCPGKGQIDRPELGSIDRAHPVNNFLAYGDVHIQTATRREPAPWLHAIVSAPGNSGLVWAGEDRGRRVVLLSFDLAATDFPVKVDFPIFVSNAISWLTGRDQSLAARSIRAGQPVVINTTGAQAMPRKTTVTSPLGDSVDLTPTADGPLVFADTFRVGKYDVAGSTPFAVSLLSESESDTSPRDTIKTRGGEIRGQIDSVKSEREVWWWLALAGFVLLSVEWWAYHRKIV